MPAGGNSVSANIQERLSRNRSPIITGSLISRDSCMTCFINREFRGVNFRIERMSDYVWMLLRIVNLSCDVFQRNIGHQGGCDVADRHGILLCPCGGCLGGLRFLRTCLRDAYRISFSRSTSCGATISTCSFCVATTAMKSASAAPESPSAICFAVHDVADRQVVVAFISAAGRPTSGRTTGVDQRFPDLASFAAVGPFGEVHGT